jgi:hypothetical protein
VKVYGQTQVSEFLGDFVVYRNLVPADERLAGLDRIRDQVGLPAGRVPRKSEAEYARVIVHLLRQARRLDAPGVAIRRLLFVGDTHLNDGTAFANICRAGEWPGLAFIGAETDQPAQTQVVNAPSPPSSPPEGGTEGGRQGGEDGGEPRLFLANRWAALADFDRFCAEQDFPIDAATAVIVDLDKTALGARGRNAHVIDQARVAAVRETVADLLGTAFDPLTFRSAYDTLNQPEFHPFTADNQDYLAYICLMLGSGLYHLEQVLADVRAGRLTSFAAFIARADERAQEMAVNLCAIHTQIYANVRAGDPTPFKPFRYNEYLTTVARMGHKTDDTPLQELLAEEILITQEVRAQALAWRSRGAMLFGLSDKPDEASVPSQELAAQGYQAIHRAETHAVGG